MSAKLVKFRNLELSHTDWAERLGLTKQAVSKRLRSMPVAEALADATERARLWRRNLRRAKAGSDKAETPKNRSRAKAG
jgi:predicted transcriptional regulator